MHSHVLLSGKHTRVINATAAGTSDVNGSTLDMAGFDSVVFIVGVGTLTATQVTSLKVQVGNAADMSDAVDLVGAVTAAFADADSNKLAVIEVSKLVGYRYCRVVVDRGTANAVIDFGIAYQFSERKGPASPDSSTVAAATLAVSPAPTTTGLTQTTTTYSGTSVKISKTERTSS